MRCLQRNIQRYPAAKLQQRNMSFARKRLCFAYQCLNTGVGSERTPIIQERHRHEVVPEESAAHPNERQNPDKFPLRSPSHHVDALVTKDALNYCTPTQAVEVGVASLSRRKVIPLTATTTLGIL